MSILSRFLPCKLKRSIHAVLHGTHKGKFLVYINQVNDEFNFLVLPENETLSINVDEFEKGIQEKIVERIEKLPYNVYQICVAQYNESKTRHDINRLKQSTTPSSVDNGEHED